MPTTSPPDIPSGVDPKLAAYLRRFASWAFQEIDKKIPKDEATPHLILTPSDQKPPTAAFTLTVDHTGAISASSTPLGGGKP